MLNKIVAEIDGAFLGTLKNKKIVFTNGCFDILHLGHITYLREAKQLGDHLIIGVNSDASVKKLKGENRPINNLNSRMQMLAALEMVDHVISFSEDTPLSLIEKINPNILVKGGDYDPENVVGAKHVKSYGGRVDVLPFISGYSTTSIIDKLKS